MTDTNLSFKEMCERFDVTPRTLRYYEYIELLSPAKQGRSRLYGPREVARMTLILRGRHFGFGLEDIRQWLEMYESEGSAPQLETFIDRAAQQLEVLDRQIADLAKARADLEELRAKAGRELAELTARSGA